MKFKQLTPLFFLIFVFFACETESKRNELPFKTKQDFEETSIRSLRAFMQKEKKLIQDYINEKDLHFDSTGTGLRFHIYQKNPMGDSLKSGDIAVVHYQLTDIEGKLLYESRADLAHEFAVDYEEVESGLHEGIKKMHVGEKAYLILPAHLAHGITGDQAAIPSQTTLVYDLHLVGKK